MLSGAFLLSQYLRQIMEHPVELGEPLKGNLREFYAWPVKRNFIIIYLYCAAYRKKGDAEFVACSDCSITSDETIKFSCWDPMMKFTALNNSYCFSKRER